MSKPAGPSIFSNWAKQPTKKKISWLNTSEVHKGRQFKNLQQQNMSRKASAVERVPPRLAQPHLAEPLHAQSPTDASPTVSSMRPTAVRPNDPREERPEGGELLTCWFWVSCFLISKERSICNAGAAVTRRGSPACTMLTMDPGSRQEMQSRQQLRL